MTTKNLTTDWGKSSPSSAGGVLDLTFDNYASPCESKYIVKAVGEILLEIQKYISNEDQGNSGSVSPKRGRAPLRTGEERRHNFRSNKVLSDDEIKPQINDINEPTEQTYHRRVLDSVISTTKKPINCQNGSLDWKEIEFNKFPVPHESRFECPELESERRLGDICLDNVSLRGNVYSVNRVKLSINTFVSSFYKHYPIVSYSSFILSLIYIDRFIKAQCAEDLSKLSRFNITR